MGIAAGLGAAAAATTIGSSISNLAGGGPQYGGAGGGSPYLYQPMFQPQADQNLQQLMNMQFGAANTLTPQLLGAYMPGGNPYASPYMGAAGASGALSNQVGLNAAAGGTTLQNAANTAAPYLAQTLAQGYGANPYASGMVGAANTAGGMAGQAGQSVFGTGTQLLGAAPQALGYGSQIMNAAMDPQQALYNRTAQQLTDQMRAQNAASGLSSSPYGAGLVDQGLSNFNIDWQNNLLNRMTQGANAYQGLSSTAAGDLGQGATALGQGIGYQQAAGALPYGAYQQGFITDPLSAQGQAGQNFRNLLGAAGQGYTGAAGLGATGAQQLLAGGQTPYNAFMNYLGGMSQGAQSAFGLPQQSMQDYMNYLGQGTSAGNLALNGQGQQFNQQQQSLAQLTNSLGLLGGVANNMNFGNLFASSQPYYGAAQGAGVPYDQYLYGGDTALGTGTFGGGY